MKRGPEPNKFYYNITIDHDPEHTKGDHLKKSKAKKTLYLEEPLVETPGNYNLAVSKFSINTESLPVMIPELAQPQTVATIDAGNFATEYVIYLKMSLATYIGPLEDEEEYPNFYDEINLVTEFYVNNLNYHSDNGNLQKIGQPFQRGGVDYTYVNNLDENCFFYDYQDILGQINAVFKHFSDQVRTRLRCPTAFNGGSFARIRIENGLLKIGVHGHVVDRYKKQFKVARFQIAFSENLYRYLGIGFRTLKAEYEENNPDFANHKFWRYSIANFNYVDDFGFLWIHQSYACLDNWNPLKAIVIGSDTLPVAEEYLPIEHNNGFLTHYKTPEHLEALRHLNLQYNEEDREIFKKKTLRILDLYYPMTSAAGDIRSTCIHSKDNVVDGQTIELMAASPITRFDIWIKWLDIYGNLHDLYLYPGCSCSIRFCFTKKTIVKEDLAEGFETVIEALEPEEKKNKQNETITQKMMKKMKKSNGKPNGIDLEGADKYGWVHL